MRPSQGTIDYIDFVRLDGVMYVGGWIGELPDTVSLGSVFGTVCRELSTLPGLVDFQDGDASFLPAGSSVFALDGHDPRTVVAAEREGKMLVYEADTNPAAKTGRDLLDFAAGLSGVRVLDGHNGTEQLGQISDPTVLADLAARIMASPIDQTPQQSHGNADRWFIELTMSDGLFTVRAFWRSTRELGRGIFLDTGAATLLEAAA